MLAHAHTQHCFHPHGAARGLARASGRRALGAVAALALFVAMPAHAQAPAEAPPSLGEGRTLSAPISHGALTIWFVRGPSAPGPVPLTLAEGIERGVVIVRETGDVNQLALENVGDTPVFVQSGDIVKGGQQDRVLTVSLIAPPKSGRIDIASFCVEQGRWSGRPGEKTDRFEASAKLMPSREGKLAMKAPDAGASGQPSPGRGRGGDMAARQNKVWGTVSKTQADLSRAVGAPVASPSSATSLQLALESKKLKEAQGDYLKALGAAPTDSDTLGLVFAIDGRINSADVYASNGLFRKMWPKLIDAAVTEALATRSAGGAAPATPSAADVVAFLLGAEKGKTSEKPVVAGVALRTHEAANAYLFDTRVGGGFAHRNYVAK